MAAYRLNFRRAVPISVVATDTNRMRLSRSFRKTTPIITAKTTLVSRNADTKASGATVMAQMAS